MDDLDNAWLHDTCLDAFTKQPKGRAVKAGSNQPYGRPNILAAAVPAPIPMAGLAADAAPYRPERTMSRRTSGRRRVCDAKLCAQVEVYNLQAATRVWANDRQGSSAWPGAAWKSLPRSRPEVVTRIVENLRLPSSRPAFHSHARRSTRRSRSSTRVRSRPSGGQRTRARPASSRRLRA